MKLRRKILFAIILLVFIPVILMGIVTYVNFSNAMEKKSSNFYWVSLLETDRKLKFALSEISSISNAAITQPVIQQSLKQTNFVLTYDRKQELNNLLINHPMITSFSLYGKDRLLYQYNAPMSFEDMKKQSWFNAMEGAEGRPVWSGPGENGSALSGHPVLVQARVIKDYYSLEDIGYLVVNVKPDLLDQIFWEAATLKKGDILLVNKLGNIVFNKSGEHIGQRTEFPFLENDYAKEQNYYIDNYQGEQSLITFLPSHNKDWYLAAITPMNLISSESISIRNIAIILSTVSLLSAILFDRYFVRRLVYSINSAVNGMKRVKQGIFTPITTRYRADDESDFLIDGFNRMSSQISELIVQVQTEQGRKKEAEMQALMAQINPHFIYNSLESINSMAVLQGNKDISKMVISLGKLLRISISQNQELIPLQMEFEHVRHYLDIQKFRFEDKFSYTINLPENLRTFMTQKLIVQPIVENALYHAIEPMEDPGIIEITAYEMGTDMIIIVKDNGPGFDLAKMMNLWDNEGGGQKKYSDSGVGLKNVHERLIIRFGSPYGLLVCSSPGFGSTIRIRIPKILP
ncbi:two-component system sensor histidine kinase YesM [Paenibacillus sp. PastF-3]|uniref:sensor histidine kinase n=1 Tax=Paenibacillus sp. PastF-3 TaxID=2940626 RepID=UPI0024740A2C|nr:sensor histidine kinase [Paenibacillus sp. PastF-3]MDH6368301.1 two-component system sensor histidine kinase YesM [Paenibacillus sp. PastF-3]